MKSSSSKKKRKQSSIDNRTRDTTKDSSIGKNQNQKQTQKQKQKKGKSSSKKKGSSIESISSLCNVVGLSSSSIDFDFDVNFNTSVNDTVHKTKNELISGYDAQQPTSSTEALEDLDSCLALMDQSIPDVAVTSALNTINTTEDEADVKVSNRSSSANTSSTSNNQLSDGILWKGDDNTEDKTLQLQLQRQRKQKRKQDQMSIEEFYLPNIQIELARHKHIGELSQFLLSKYKHLRMPTFERWLIDSKMEERVKRIAIEKINSVNANVNHDSLVHTSYTKKQVKEKKWKERLKRKNQKNPNDKNNGNGDSTASAVDEKVVTSLGRHLTSSGMKTLNDYDYVIPSMADLDDDATQHLIEEIVQEQQQSSSSTSTTISFTEAQSVCRELCQKSCTAARNLQNLNQHLGGPIHINQYLQRHNKKKRSSKSSSNSSSISTIGTIQLKIEDSEESSSNSNSNDGVTTPSSPSTYSLVYSRKSNKKGNDKKMKPFVVKINAKHYDKLRSMFNSIHAHNEKLQDVPPAKTTLKKSFNENTASTKIFHHLIFCILVRYSALSGGQQLLDLRGGGMQGAIHSQVFDCLSNFCQSDSIIECFASPLNVYNREYCSIFHADLDYHFGSSGDFFTVPLGHFQQKNCSNVHEANPPFSPSLMKLMVERLVEHLEYADNQYDRNDSSSDDGLLTFVIVVPTCKSNKDSDDSTSTVQNYASESFRQMLTCPYFVKHITLKAREHGYVEGSQHLRKTRYKESQYSTSVVVLQSRRAREKEEGNPQFTSNQFDVEIRKAFSSRHNLELDERRIKSDSQADDIQTLKTEPQRPKKKRKKLRKKQKD